jgi:hypothetical protein
VGLKQVVNHVRQRKCVRNNPRFARVEQVLQKIRLRRGTVLREQVTGYCRFDFERHGFCPPYVQYKRPAAASRWVLPETEQLSFYGESSSACHHIIDTGSN